MMFSPYLFSTVRCAPSPPLEKVGSRQLSAGYFAKAKQPLDAPSLLFGRARQSYTAHFLSPSLVSPPLTGTYSQIGTCALFAAYEVDTTQNIRYAAQISFSTRRLCA